MYICIYIYIYVNSVHSREYPHCGEGLLGPSIILQYMLSYCVMSCYVILHECVHTILCCSRSFVDIHHSCYQYIHSHVSSSICHSCIIRVHPCSVYAHVFIHFHSCIDHFHPCSSMFMYLHNCVQLAVVVQQQN